MVMTTLGGRVEFRHLLAGVTLIPTQTYATVTCLDGELSARYKPRLHGLPEVGHASLNDEGRRQAQACCIFRVCTSLNACPKIEPWKGLTLGST